MDKVEELLSKHKWPSVCRRVSIVPPDERVTIPGYNGGRRKTKYFCQSEGFSRMNKTRMHLSEPIMEILPDWFVPEENFCITVNKNVQTYPHRDSLNKGDAAILFLGDFTGGALHAEDGSVISEKRVWHRFNNKDLLHWNEPHQGTKYSIIAANNRQPICYHRQKKEAT